MRPFRIILTAIVLLLLHGQQCDAQSWQWAKRGGSPNGPVGSTGYDETLVDLATDVNGNVYTLSYVYVPFLNIDGHAKTGWSSGEVLLSSFKCDGSYRWSKIMGGHQNDHPITVKTDTLGGVYITGYIIANSSSLAIDVDTSWTGGPRKTMFLAKFDTGGNYKWFHMPQADTVGPASVANSAIYDMDVDKAGNIFIMCHLMPGAYEAGAYVVSTKATYLLQYNKNGFFQGGTPMQISFAGGSSPFFKMRRNHTTGRCYVTGDRPFFTSISFGSTSLAHTLYVGCFNSAGTCLWVRENVNNLSNSFRSSLTLDDAGNVYFSGEAVHNDTFNSYIVSNAANPNGQVMVAKMDADGNHLWGRNSNGASAMLPSAMVVSGNKLGVTGSYGGWFGWGSDTIIHAYGCGYTPFLARLNTTTGAYAGVDSVNNQCGTYSDTYAITADKGGNFYIGGYFPSELYIVGVDTLIANIGGGTGVSDFYVAKFGMPTCTCTLPAAAFTSTGTSTKNFTYTGTATYDSVRWDFGDGGTSTLASPTHTFAAGTYTVCMTVYTACGSDVHCQTFTVSPTTEIAGTAFEGLSIYPNPVTGELYIDNLGEGSIIRVLNIMGTEVYRMNSTTGRAQIDMRAMPAGNYIIQLTNRENNIMRTLITKR